MIARSRELLLSAVLVAALGCGLAFEGLAGEVDRPGPERIPGRRFTARAVFCSPSLSGADTSFAVAALERAAAVVEVEPHAARRAVTELAPDRVLVHKVEERSGANVIGYGTMLGASAATQVDKPVDGEGAAECTAVASTSWYFAEGSSALDYDERLLIYNPFADEAVVQITTFGPRGDRSKANLSDVAVPSRSSVVVSLNDFILRHPFLSVAVNATRGRVVAWRALLAKPDDRADGLQFSLGATAVAQEWHFPDGAVGNGYEETLALLNPTEEEAAVEISLVTNKEILQPPKLLELAVPPQSSRSIALADFVQGRQKELGAVGAVVRSTNGVGVVAERTVWYSTSRLEGVASTVGSPVLADRWWLGPAAVAPQTDVVVVMNPGSTDVRVTITFLRRFGAPLAPAELDGVNVPSGARIRIPVGDTTGGAPAVALIEATGPVAVERFSYSDQTSDVAALMGVPIP